jgi:hypothetical protein
MKTTTLLLTTLFTTLLTGPALAQESRADDGKSGVKHYDFDDDQVDADRLSPEGILIETVPRARHKSLIDLRTNFDAEMLKGLENL